MKSGL